MSRSEIIHLLNQFQEGYTQRDPELADAFMEKLFVKDTNIVVLGTSSSEWCFGYEQVKDLIVSDWKYWGDVCLDIENTQYHEAGDTCWFAVAGTVKMHFEDSEAKQESYLNYIKSYFQDDNDRSKLPMGVRLSEMLWTLTHYRQPRHVSSRDYLWPIRMTGVACREQGRYVIQQLHFAFPVVSGYPDERAASFDDMQVILGKARLPMDAFRMKKGHNPENGLAALISDLPHILMNMSAAHFVRDCFFSPKDCSLIGTGPKHYIGYEEVIDAVTELQGQWDRLVLDPKDFLITVENDAAWLIGSGYAVLHMDENSYNYICTDNIQKILDSNWTKEEKLFRVQQSIAYWQKEASKGSECIWPLRLEAFVERQNGLWKLHKMHFSYPFAWILEGKI